MLCKTPKTRDGLSKDDEDIFFGDLPSESLPLDPRFDDVLVQVTQFRFTPLRRHDAALVRYPTETFKPRSLNRGYSLNICVY